MAATGVIRRAEPARNASEQPRQPLRKTVGRVWEWIARPTHHRAVEDLRSSLVDRDRHRVAALLDSNVALMIEGGGPTADGRRVLMGARDVTEMLLHGTTDEPGLEVLVRSVNSQAGLLVMRGAQTVATILVDYSAGLVSTVWVRLHPPTLRHGNRV